MLNLPALIDRKKFIKLDKLDTKMISDKPHTQMSLLEKIKFKALTKKHITDEPKMVDNMLNKLTAVNRQMHRSSSVISIDKKIEKESKEIKAID